MKITQHLLSKPSPSYSSSTQKSDLTTWQIWSFSPQKSNRPPFLPIGSTTSHLSLHFTGAWLAGIELVNKNHYFTWCLVWCNGNKKKIHCIKLDNHLFPTYTLSINDISKLHNQLHCQMFETTFFFFSSSLSSLLKGIFTPKILGPISFLCLPNHSPLLLHSQNFSLPPLHPSLLTMTIPPSFINIERKTKITHRRLLSFLFTQEFRPFSHPLHSPSLSKPQNPENCIIFP